MSSSTMDVEDLAGLAVGGRARRNTRIRRALIARLLSEQGEGGEETTGDGAPEESEDEERQLVRLLAGTRLLKRRRLRRLVLAHLLSEGGEGEGEYEGEEDVGTEGVEMGDEDTDRERQFVRMVVGSRMLRRRRVRRALLAHLIKQRGETEEPEGEEETGEEDFDLERQLARLLIGGRALRRRRMRRAAAFSY